MLERVPITVNDILEQAKRSFPNGQAYLDCVVVEALIPGQTMAFSPISVDFVIGDRSIVFVLDDEAGDFLRCGDIAHFADDVLFEENSELFWTMSGEYEKHPFEAVIGPGEDCSGKSALRLV